MKSPLNAPIAALALAVALAPGLSLAGAAGPASAQALDDRAANAVATPSGHLPLSDEERRLFGELRCLLRPMKANGARDHAPPAYLMKRMPMRVESDAALLEALDSYAQVIRESLIVLDIVAAQNERRDPDARARAALLRARLTLGAVLTESAGDRLAARLSGPRGRLLSLHLPVFEDLDQFEAWTGTVARRLQRLVRPHGPLRREGPPTVPEPLEAPASRCRVPCER